MAKGLGFLFEPSSVALIGASPNPLKWGGWMAKQLTECGYKGDIYFVSTKGGVVFGRETYKNIQDIQNPLDLAIIGIPAHFVADAVKDCVKKGVKVIIIITAGFGETGEQGRRVENELVRIASKGDARIIGPNCMGVYNAAISLNTSALRLPAGFFAFLTQSGNFAMDVNYGVRQRGLGYSKWVSFGNQVDVRFWEYLDYVKDDPNTKVILMYMEGLYVDSVKDGREFLKIAKETAKNKPMVAIKIGTGAAGVRSALSHTGSLAGSNEIYDAALKQVGIIRVLNSFELLDIGEALSKCPLPQGNRIAILTDGGGHGTTGSDAAERYNLEVPILSHETQEKLKKILPPQGSTQNPVDFAGGAEADLWNFARCSEVLLEDEGVDGLVIVGQYGGYALDLSAEFAELEQRVAEEIVNLLKRYNKPIINHTMYAPNRPKPLQTFSEGGIPVYACVETAMMSMSALVERKNYLDKLREIEKEKPIRLPQDRINKVKTIIDKIKDARRTNLLETEAREILKTYDVPMSDFRLAKSKEEAARIAREMSYPITMKIVSPDIIHKSDAGGVKLDLKDENDVEKAFDEIMKNAKAYKTDAEINGVLVSPMETVGT